MSDQPPYPLHDSIVNRIHPQYASFYNKHLINQQQVHLQPIEASRSSGILIPGSGPLQKVASTVDYVIQRQESQGPDLRVRCFMPEGERPENGWPVCVYFHGGGWVLGTIDTENVIASHLCTRGKCVVVAVDYRLAPEDPFPAAVEDSWEGVLWILGKGKEVLHLNISKMAAGGSSAGANLAAIMCQRAITRSLPPFTLQLLSVPVMNNTLTPTTCPPSSSWLINQHAPALPAAKMLWYRSHYLPDKSTWSHPEASPIFWEGDWAKLPPACMVVGELDVLRSEGEEFGEKLREGGVKADVHVMKGIPHPFIAMDGVLEAGERAIRLFCEALYGAMYGEI